MCNWRLCSVGYSSVLQRVAVWYSELQLDSTASQTEHTSMPHSNVQHGSSICVSRNATHQALIEKVFVDVYCIFGASFI